MSNAKLLSLFIVSSLLPWVPYAESNLNRPSRYDPMLHTVQHVPYRGTPNDNSVSNHASLIEQDSTVVTAVPTPLLKKCPGNGRWLCDANGKGKYLVGAHQGEEFQDYIFGSTGPSDWSKVTTLFKYNNLNLIRMWVAEHVSSGKLNPVSPYARSSICCINGADAGHLFDLSQFSVGNISTTIFNYSGSLNSSNYMERLRARIIDAQTKGIYVSIMLFHSFGWETGGRNSDNTSWSTHPFNARNNINGVNGDADGNGSGEDVGTTGRTWNIYQENYVKQVIDSVNDLDNVIYEVCNECFDSLNVAWVNAMVSTIKGYEATKAKQHPVLVSSYNTPNNDMIYNNREADIAVPGGDWIIDPINASPASHVALLDSDHFTGVCQTYPLTMAWKQFTRGYGSWLIYGCVADGLGNPTANEKEVIRRMGQTKAWADLVPIQTMVPTMDPDECSSTYCLKGIDAWIGYLPSGGTISLYLPDSGTYTVQWLNVQTGAISWAPNVIRGSCKLSSPFVGEAAVLLLRDS